MHKIQFKFYILLSLWGFAPEPQRSSGSGPRLRTSFPQTPYKYVHPCPISKYATDCKMNNKTDGHQAGCHKANCDSCSINQ